MKAMENWVELEVERRVFIKVIIQRGIFQLGSLSPLLFLITMMQMNYIQLYTNWNYIQLYSNRILYHNIQTELCTIVYKLNHIQLYTNWIVYNYIQTELYTIIYKLNYIQLYTNWIIYHHIQTELYTIIYKLNNMQLYTKKMHCLGHYRFIKSQEKTDHLIYMDNIKFRTLKSSLIFRTKAKWLI